MCLWLGIVGTVACLAAAVSALEQPSVMLDQESSRNSVREYGVLAALPIELERPFINDWSAEHAPVVRGWLLALEVDPRMLVRHQVADPVLFVGDQVVERINRGDVSGRVIVIVPERVNLSESPVYFGSAALPERVDAAMRRAELERARDDAGAAALEGAVLRECLERGSRGVSGGVGQFRDRRELLDFAAQWIYEYCPEESDFASKLLLLPSDK